MKERLKLFKFQVGVFYIYDRQYFPFWDSSNFITNNFILLYLKILNSLLFLNDNFIFLKKIYSYQIKLNFHFVYNKIKITKNSIVN